MTARLIDLWSLTERVRDVSCGYFRGVMTPSDVVSATLELVNGRADVTRGGAGSLALNDRREG